MKNFKKEFEFILNEELDYSDSGDAKKTKRLILRAPANIHRNETFRLRQGLLKGMTEAQARLKSSTTEEITNNNQNQTNEIDDEIDGQGILTGLFMSDIDMVEYMALFERLLLNGCCIVDGKINLTDGILKKISIDDEERLLGEYIANFIFPSWMKNQMNR